jgi:uncharacterized protein (TIGR00369 family)
LPAAVTTKPAPAHVTLAELRRLIGILPFNSHLGITLARRHRDGVTVECPIRPEYLNMHGTLHGGLTATLIDVAGGFATLAHYGVRPAATVDMKVNYFLPIAGRRFSARSKLLRAGKTLSVCQVEVFDEKKRLAAFGMITYILTTLGAAPPPPG